MLALNMKCNKEFVAYINAVSEYNQYSFLKFDMLNECNTFHKNLKDQIKVVDNHKEFTDYKKRELGHLQHNLKSFNYVVSVYELYRKCLASPVRG